MFNDVCLVVLLTSYSGDELFAVYTSKVILLVYILWRLRNCDFVDWNVKVPNADPV